MASEKRRKFRLRVGLAVVTIAALAVGIFIWFEYLGLWNRSSLPVPIANVLNRVGSTAPLINGNDVLLLERERLAKREQAVALQQEALARRERGLLFRENQLATQERELLAFESNIVEREKGLISEQNRYENERAVLAENVRQLNAMRPEDAVSILQEYDDQLLVDTFQTAQQLSVEAGEFSLVPLWLSLLPPDRASAVQRKSVIKYGN